MSADIWVVSDTHFGHANMLKFTNPDGTLCRPGFRDADHMDEVMIEKWNAVIKPTDKVYHCGDFCFSNKVMARVAPRLNGKKRLLLGNHDTLDMGVYMKHFQKIGMWRQFTDKDVAIVLTHTPMHKGSFMYRFEDACCNVHGHIHNRVIQDTAYINVCVEHTDYAPVHIDDLFARTRRHAASVAAGRYHPLG